MVDNDEGLGFTANSVGVIERLIAAVMASLLTGAPHVKSCVSVSTLIVVVVGFDWVCVVLQAWSDGNRRQTQNCQLHFWSNDERGWVQKISWGQLTSQGIEANDNFLHLGLAQACCATGLSQGNRQS